MNEEPRLSGDQQRQISLLASTTGQNWRCVLDQALDFSRVHPKSTHHPLEIVGLFADEPELMDAVTGHAYKMRETASLRTRPNA